MPGTGRLETSVVEQETGWISIPALVINVICGRIQDVRFSDFEQRKYCPTSRACSSLDAWYQSVREVPLDQLGVGDICRALRQDLYVREVLPVAIAFFEDDVFAGDRYDGELLYALVDLSEGYWRENAEASRKARLALAIDISDLDFELSKCAFALIKTLESVN